MRQYAHGRVWYGTYTHTCKISLVCLCYGKNYKSSRYMLLAVNGSTPVRLTITTNVDLLYYVLFYLHPKCTPRARVARRHGHCSPVALERRWASCAEEDTPVCI